MATLGHPAQQKNLELIYDVHPDVPEALLGYPGRLRQILVNLVGNSIKFTEPGEVLVSVEIEVEPGPSVALKFSVKDTGVGIAADKQQQIFEAFTQADGSMARKYGGTGLGLAICTRLAGLMGGKTWVESVVGQGSTFYFTATFQAQSDDVLKRPPPRHLEELRGLDVLIVDDNLTNRRLLVGILSRWGMTPTAGDDSYSALRALDAANALGRPFPLILLDGQMPVIDGFALAEQIQEQSALVHATVMMLTSAGHLGDAARCRELGISAYLVKPVRQRELLEAICQSLSLGPRPPAALPLITRHTLREDKPAARILLAEDNAVNQVLAVRLLERRGYFVTVAADGQAALDALEIGQFDAVLMDIQMPCMDGFEATAAIRQKEKTTGQHIPIIAMTAHALKSDQARCIAAGMDGYVSKLIRTAELISALESLTARSRAIAPA